MAITQVISEIPEAGHRGVDVRDDFVVKQEAFQDALTDTFVTEINSVATQINSTSTNINNIETNVQELYDSATTYVASVSNTVKWVSGTTYLQGDCVWSPTTYQAYRAKSNTSATVDPSQNSGVWESITTSNKFKTYKNYVINGSFNVWQALGSDTNFTGIGRTGTSTNSNGHESADMWWTQVYPGASGSGFHSMRIDKLSFTKGQTEINNNPTYYFKFGASSVGTASGTDAIIRAVTSIRDVAMLSGKQVTLSFWAKADTNRTYAFIANQNFGSGGSTSTVAYQNTMSLTTSWKKISYTFTMPSVLGKTIGSDSATDLAFILYKSGNGIYNDTLGTIGIFSTTPKIYLSNVQLEESAAPTEFEMLTYQEEFDRCKRYCYAIDLGSIFRTEPPYMIKDTTYVAEIATIPEMNYTPTCYWPTNKGPSENNVIRSYDTGNFASYNLTMGGTSGLYLVSPSLGVRQGTNKLDISVIANVSNSIDGRQIVGTRSSGMLIVCQAY